MSSKDSQHTSPTESDASDEPKQHHVHSDHPLLYLKTPTSPWTCDLCKRSSSDILDKSCHHCKKCNFHVCKDCVAPVNSQLHVHPLHRTDVKSIYSNHGGIWFCDACGTQYRQNFFPAHCHDKSCEFDLCDNCIKPYRSTAHDEEHALYKADSKIVYPRFNGQWRCDGCSQSFIPQVNNLPFHCSQCEFDLCEKCMNSTGGSAMTSKYSLDPQHEGPTKADACDGPKHHPVRSDHNVYPKTPTSPWACDVCKQHSSDISEKSCHHCDPLHRTDVKLISSKRNGTWKCDVCRISKGPDCCPAHCQSCEFDLCDNCIKPYRSTAHKEHTLYKADSRIMYRRFNGEWRCDRCSRSFIPQVNNLPFHCSQCEFDLCETCLTETTGPSDTGISKTRSPVNNSNNNQPITAPDGDEEVGRTGPPVNPGNCVLCLDRLKDVTIRHGDSGHVCCCSQCATELHLTRDVCPICRAPIQGVVKHFIS